MKHFGLWLALLAAALLVVLPASAAALPGLALAPELEAACSRDTGPSDRDGRLASEAPGDTEEEEKESDGDDDDDVAHAHAREASITATAGTTRRHATTAADGERRLGLREHAPRGPPPIR